MGDRGSDDEPGSQTVVDPLSTSAESTPSVAGEADVCFDRGRPLLRHLQQHQSTSILPSEDHPAQQAPRLRRRP
jgi:hypothetical protein